jgi:protein gp37
MSDNSSIEWTDASWNPITGCTKISEGCRHCYAQRMAARFAGRNGYPKDKPFTPGTEHIGQWHKPVLWRKPRKIFVCSMGDLFHADVTDAQIQKVLDCCQYSKHHTFQILTKRPERCKDFIYPKNVWLGTTVESHTEYHRIDALAECAVSVRFVSCEPLLSPLITIPHYLKHIDWVIAGAETGPNARQMDLAWARYLRDICLPASIPFFFKRDSVGRGTLDGIEYHQFPVTR